MSADDKGMIALRQRHGQVITDLGGFFRRDLPRLEGLPQMIGDHIVVLVVLSGKGFILALGE